jgi:alkanesulfonate monooxygenase SsuD/methylene tetrahydromethanopterin reductase-like flavin-dependent oxidoreductase (luciferase family)
LIYFQSEITALRRDVPFQTSRLGLSTTSTGATYLAEEVVMLDQLSNGRYDVGVGRGISPIEVRLYGGDPATSQEVFDEALEVMKLAWTQETVTFAGKRFRFDAVPVVTHPVQKPYPPLWYGVGTASGAANWLERGFHGITMSTRASVKDVWRSPAARNACGSRVFTTSGSSTASRRCSVSGPRNSTA